MKILIVSDTHKSHRNLERILKEVHPVDLLIHLGDTEGGEDDIAALEPLRDGDPAFVLEFKVHDPEDEKTLADTVAAALRQIEEKAYDTELAARGILRERIRHYGFAFEGKTVLIG